MRVWDAQRETDKRTRLNLARKEWDTIYRQDMPFISGRNAELSPDASQVQNEGSLPIIPSRPVTAGTVVRNLTRVYTTPSPNEEFQRRMKRAEREHKVCAALAARSAARAKMCRLY
eukprot:5407218-Prymnesium_polylepis.2